MQITIEEWIERLQKSKLTVIIVIIIERKRNNHSGKQPVLKE